MRAKLLIISLLVSVAAMSQVERPRLVVGLVVDQMRWDYLYRFQDEFGEDGFKRILRDGYSCENTMINYVPTVTSIGHASVYTGSTPALHGICGNNFYIDKKEVYCCADTTVRSVGSDGSKGQMSPHYMLASTIGDELKLSTNFRSRVFGVAIKDRAAILPAGHSADAAYWWDSDVGHFVSSTFYMKELPAWVQEFNKKNHTKPKFNIISDNQGVSVTFRMAEALLDHEQLGQRGETDMLTISISSTDAIAHQKGIDGADIHSVFQLLDQELGKFLKTLDSKVGRGQYLLFLTADHGGAHNYNYLKRHRIPAAGLESWGLVKPLDEHLSNVFGVSKLVVGENVGRIFLDHELIEKSGLSLGNVKQEVIRWMCRDKRFMTAVDFADAVNAPLPQLIRERICNGYNPERTGDVIGITRPQVVITTDKPDFEGTSHSAWNPYDAHIPFVLMGWKVSHGATTTPTFITDIAPTICSMLHIEAPNAAIGNAVPIGK